MMRYLCGSIIFIRHSVHYYIITCTPADVRIHKLTDLIQLHTRVLHLLMYLLYRIINHCHAVQPEYITYKTIYYVLDVNMELYCMHYVRYTLL
jgi:hypothetical protein